MCVGDWLQKLINFVTMGFGKPIAQKVANWFGFEDCGCSKRQQLINDIFKCNKGVQL